MKVIQRASRAMELVMKEALCIRPTQEDVYFNCDGGHKPPDCWITNLHRLGAGSVLSELRPRHA